MMKSASAFACMALACMLAPTQAHALDDELKIGQSVFQELCASCHGAEGNGDGVIADLFKVRPRALSQLSKENGGEYPFELVYQTLKATRNTKAHGDTAMPVWGDYFQVNVLDDPTVDETESFVALGKLLSVIYYIETLQDK